MLTNSTIFRNGNCGRGSLGGFFYLAGDVNTVYGLSNNHVIANINNCNQGDAVFNSNNVAIGTLQYWVQLNNTGMNFIDAALFIYNSSEPLQWRLPASLTKPRGFIEPRLKGNVYMMLENNDQNRGFISTSYINYKVEFSLCGSKFLFTNIIEITPFTNTPFSVPGESGSLIMSSNHCIVGLLIGTNADTTKSYAIPFVDGILNVLPLVIV